MKDKIFREALAVGIILLFVGVAVQPAFANEVSITTSSDNEDDCNCHPVSNLHLVRLKSLLNRLETYNNRLSVMSKHNPDIEEKYQELSNKIITFLEMNEDLKPNKPIEDNQTICFILFLLFCKQIFSALTLISIYDFLYYYPVLHLLFLPLFFIFREKISITGDIIMNIGVKKKCDWAVPYWMIEFNM